MNFTDAPAYTPIPFAVSGTKNTIPPSTSTPGAASFTDGFPLITFVPISTGGIPPAGADFNGILFDVSSAQQWQQAGGVYSYNSTFSTAVTGYPKGAFLRRADNQGYWLNLTDANTANPDTGGGGWASVRANIGTKTFAISIGTNIPTADQIACGVLLLTGSIASSATLQLPLVAGANWIIANNTTGAGTLNVQGVSGASAAIAQGASLQVYCDGAGYFAASTATAGSWLPLHGTADAAVKLATARAFSMSGLVTATGFNFDGTTNVNYNVTALNVPGALGYTPANDANVVHKTGNESVGGIKTLTSALNGTSATFSGLLTCATFNATASDRRLKSDIREVAPRPLHRHIPFVSYKIKKTKAAGRGAIAQDVLAFAPTYVGEFKAGKATRLSIDKPGLAYEQAMWAGLELDRLAQRVADLERPRGLWSRLLGFFA